MKLDATIIAGLIGETLKIKLKIDKAADEAKKGSSDITNSQIEAVGDAKILLANDHNNVGKTVDGKTVYTEHEEFVGWWAIADPEVTQGTNMLIFSELVKIIKQLAGETLGASYDPSNVKHVDIAKTALSYIKDIKSGCDVASGKTEKEDLSQLKAAWAAGAFDSAVGTAYEFAIAADHVLYGGPVYITQSDELKKATVEMNSYPKQQFNSLRRNPNDAYQNAIGSHDDKLQAWKEKTVELANSGWNTFVPLPADLPKEVWNA